MKILLLLTLVLAVVMMAHSSAKPAKVTLPPELLDKISKNILSHSIRKAPNRVGEIERAESKKVREKKEDLLIERERQRQPDRQRQRHAQRQTQKQIQRQSQRQRQTESEREREKTGNL